MPSMDDVVQNLTNLANTEFTNFSRFHQCGSQQTAKISNDLPYVVVSMLECITENINIKAKTEGRDAIITNLRNSLEDLNFLPVKLRVNGYALVKPAQVLIMNSSSLLPYYPFLHPLEENLRQKTQLLSQIGVEMSLNFSHIQLYFKLAKDLCKDKKVDINIKRAAAKTTEELIVLLRNATSAGNKADIHLQPLYLLNEQDVLTECSKLIVFDISGSRLALPNEFTYLNSLTGFSTSIHWSTEELLNLLPQDVGLKSLKSIMEFEMFDSIPAQNPYACITTIEQILRSNVFKTAIEKYACYCIRNRQPPKIVTEILTEFQNNLQVEYLVDVLVKPQLIIDDEVVLLQDTICQEFFLQSCDGRYILSLKNTPSWYPPRVIRKMSKHLCSVLQLQTTQCFELSEDNEVPELTYFVCDLLNCGSVFKLADVIIEELPGCDDIEQDMEPANPVLGEIIPDCWHHRLDQNIFNYFMPTEWVGYEDKDGRIVYAQILHISDIPASSEETLQQFLQQKYTITTGSDTPIETTILKLFKFRSSGSSGWSSDTSQVFRSSGSGFSSSGWSGWFHQWDRTASSHCRYRSRDRARGSTSRGMAGYGGWNIPKPKKENSEAKRWIKQAEYDYAALSGLDTLSQTDDKTCAATCFMSHEVAEKALKAGMYAKCGMSDTLLKCHSLVSPARALMQVGCLTDVDDAVFLENFYSQPRFPYCYPSPIVPGEKYLSSTAREAFQAATRIYEEMKQLVEDDE